MTDPLSIVLAAGSLIESCFKIAKFIYTIYTIDEEIGSRCLNFSRHVDHLRGIVEQLRSDFDPLEPVSNSCTGTHNRGTQCVHVLSILKDCYTSLNSLVVEIEKLQGNTSSRGFQRKVLRIARYYFNAENLALKRKEVKTYTMILQLSLQTVSLSYHRTTTTQLDELAKQLRKVQSTTDMLCSALLSGEVERPQKRVDHLKQWAEKERHIFRNASTTAIGAGHKKRKADTRSHILPKQKKAMVEWIRWPDSSTPVCSSVSSHSPDQGTRTLKPRNSAIQSRAGDLYSSEAVSEVSSTTEDGTFERLIRLAKEKYASRKYKKAETVLEYALRQAMSTTQYAFTDDFYTYPEAGQDHAQIREILELLLQCYDKLGHWDRVDVMLQDKDRSLATRSISVLPLRDIMVELLCGQGQPEKAESIGRKTLVEERSNR